jgi:nucleoside 2-deoxyribosyltransferase
MTDSPPRPKLVYLAGPIDLVDRAEAQGWREKAAKKLKKKGFGVFSPAHAFEVDPDALTRDSAQSILAINSHAMQHCDAILANLTGPGYGTPIEFDAMIALGKIAASFNGNTNSLYVKVWPHYDSMDEAIDALVKDHGKLSCTKR